MPELPNRNRHRALTCLGLAIATLIAGLIWRMAPLHLPAFLFKYGGSVLWAAMVYWILAGALPRMRPLRVALCASAVAVLLECIRLFHSPGLDAFRDTLAGKLLLGRYFAIADIAAYLLAIAVASALDGRLLGRQFAK